MKAYSKALDKKSRCKEKNLLRESVDEDVVDKFSTFTPEISKFRVMSRKVTAKKRFQMSPYALLYDEHSECYDFSKKNSLTLAA